MLTFNRLASRSHWLFHVSSSISIFPWSLAGSTGLGFIAESALVAWLRAWFGFSLVFPILTKLCRTNYCEIMSLMLINCCPAFLSCRIQLRVPRINDCFGSRLHARCVGPLSHKWRHRLQWFQQYVLVFFFIDPILCLWKCSLKLVWSSSLPVPFEVRLAWCCLQLLAWKVLQVDIRVDTRWLISAPTHASWWQ